MARPLTKKRKKDGRTYVRPASVEASINVALGQDLATIRQRLQVTDTALPDYLVSECLVHLIRESIGRGDDKLRDGVVEALLKRCEVILKRAIPDSRPNAASLREEVLQEFALLLASDGTGDNPDELDYFECRFNSAFMTFRIDLLRKERRRTKRIVALPDERSDSDDATPIAIDEALCRRASQGDKLAWAEILDALPPEVREAVVLVYEMGFAIESQDPNEQTAATICGVTGRTIHNRLRRAAKYLPHLNQEEL